MDKEKLEHYKKLLLQEREELVATIDLMEDTEPNDSLSEYYNELSHYDNHPADIGTETYEMAMNINLKNNEIRLIKEVDNAIKRIKNNQYGKCVSCGKEIEEERLEILPTALECTDCENRDNDLYLEDKTSTRPIEEEVLGVPFGKAFKDSDDNYNGFDGEDSWQAVARYNKTKENEKALDWYDNNMYDENILGVVDKVDKYSRNPTTHRKGD